MVIISSISPGDLELNLKLKYKYNHYIIYAGKYGYFAHILRPAEINVWKNSVRNFIDQGKNKFLFIGKGQQIVENSYPGCIITGQVNLSGENPLIGKNDDKYGPRFFDVTDLYSEKMRRNIFKRSAGFVAGNVLIPKSLDSFTDLEQKVMAMDEMDFVAATKDVFAGALSAKHAKAESAGLILFKEKYNLSNILELKKIS